YNANPASTRAALEVLTERAPGSPKVAVLGSMFELGSEEGPGHRQVGAFAAEIPNLTLLVTVGEIAELIAQGAREAGLDAGKVHSFADTPEAVDFLRRSLPERAWVLVKGSRGMKMERVVKGLLTE
ncbi:MAG TPA: cyanophycin synthetase, partial [Verrucomicrobiae bacterium]|nr:cyanophycin synthetase [Verrucomicrobiae bacterium]